MHERCLKLSESIESFPILIYHRMKYLVFFLFSVLVLTSCINDNPPIGMSPRIFRGTSAWKAVKAIMKDDTCALAKELNINPDLRHVTDPYYGYTILSTAILNNKINSVEKLLKFGFDPNYINDSLNLTRESPVIHAVSFTSTSPKILELVLKYGGDPNAYQAFQKYKGELVPFEMHAITFVAKRHDIESTRLLLEYGAEVNPPTGCTPVNVACSLSIDNLLYLLEHGADPYEKFYYVDDSTEYRTVADRLRWRVFPLDSKEYQIKLKVIKFLEDKGLNYRETKIPDKVLKRIIDEYPDTWEEYIKVY